MLVLLSLSAALGAPTPPPKFELSIPENSAPIQELCYPSGLEVLIEPDHRQPAVTITTAIDGGFGDAPRGREQTPHLVEHLWFRSVQGHGQTVRQQTLQLGADTNAWTDLDATTYVTSGPTSALDGLLQLEGSRLADPVAGLTDDAVATEKDVVRNELRERLGDGQLDAWSILRSSVFPEGHPYHSDGLDTVKSVDAVTRDDLSAFAKSWYKPENTTISIVGDVDVDQVTSAIARDVPEVLLYQRSDGTQVEVGDCSPRKFAAAPAPAPSGGEPRMFTGPIRDTLLLVGWPLPPAYTTDEIDARVAVDLVDTAVWAYTADFAPDDLAPSCSYEPGARASMAVCAIPLRRDVPPDRALRFVRAGLAELWTGQMSPDLELVYGRARASAFGGLLRSIEEVPSPWDSSSVDPVRYAHFTGTPTWWPDAIAGLVRLDVDGARAFGNDHLSGDHLASIVLLPPGRQALADDGAAASAPSDGGSGADNRQTLSSGQAAAMSSMFEALPPLSSAPDVRRIAHVPDLSAMRQETLPNGLRVVVLKYGTAPVAHVAVRFGGGWAEEPVPGLDALTDALLYYDPKPLKTRILDASLRIGATWDWAADAVGRTTTISGASGNVADELYLLSRYAEQTYTWFDGKKYVIDAAEHEADLGDHDPDARASRLRALHVLGPVWGLTGHDRARAEDTIGLSAIEAWRKRLYRPDNATVYVVGDVDPQAAVELVTTTFGDWKAAKAPTTPVAAPPPAPAAPAREVVVFDSDRAMASVELACPLGASTDEARGVLRETFDQLLWTSLRDASGLTYTPQVRAVSFPGVADELKIGADVTPDRAGATVATLLATIGSVHAGAPSPLVDAVKVHRASTFALDYRTGADMVSRLAEADEQGGIDTLVSRPDRLAAVDAGALSRALDACEGHEVVTVVGPAKAVGDALQAAGVPYASEPSPR